MASSIDRSKQPNHDRQIIVVSIVFAALSTAALCLRLLSKRLKRSQLTLEDFLAIIAWVLTLGESIMIANETRIGGLGRHITSLTKAEITSYLKMFYAVGFLQTTALAMAKLSILVLLHRIFVGSTFRLVTRILGVIVIGWWLSFMFTYAFICSPIRANWEPSIPHHCGNTNVVNIVAPAPWILTDFMILISPLPVIRKLQMRRSDKIGLSALFLTGGLTCVIACYRYSTLWYDKVDVTWSTTGAATWSVIETNASVICACLITIKPALHFLFPEKLINNTRRSWSRLMSSHLSRNSKAHDESYMNRFNGSSHIRAGAPRLPLYDEPFTNGRGLTSTKAHSVPLDEIKIEHHESLSGDSV